MESKRSRIEPLTYTVLGKRYTEKFSLAFPTDGEQLLKAITESTAGVSVISGTATTR